MKTNLNIMKTSIISSIIISLVILLSSELKAQNPIPSFNVPVVIDPTIFEELTVVNSSIYQFAMKSKIAMHNKSVRGEKVMKIRTKDNASNNNAFTDFYIYAVDTTLQYGPYNCTEGSVFSKTLSSNYMWGVRVINASNDCYMDVWFE